MPISSFFFASFFFCFMLTTTESHNTTSFWSGEGKRNDVWKVVGLQGSRKQNKKLGGGGWYEVFTFWVVGKPRRWGRGRRSLCPWTLRSNVGPQVSCCWCLRCRRCWAWQPWPRLSSALGPLSLGPSAEFDLQITYGVKSENLHFCCTEVDGSHKQAKITGRTHTAQI